MKKYFLLVFFAIVNSFSVHSQSCDKLIELGIKAYEEKRYEDAITYFEKSLPKTKKKYGLHDQYYDLNLEVLATSCYRAHKYEKGELYFSDLMVLRETTLGIYSTEYVGGLDYFSSVFFDLRMFDKAIPLLLRSLAIRKTYADTNSLGCAEVFSTLAGIYFESAAYDSAEFYFRKATDIWKEQLGQKDTLYADGINMLGEVYQEKRLYKRAESFFLESLNIRREILGKTHPYYAESLENLGSLYQNLNQLEKAEALYKEAIEIFKKLGEKYSLDYASSIEDLATLYADLNKYDIAEEMLIESANIRKQVLGENHPQYATSLTNLGRLYMEVGQYEKAESFFLKAVEIRRISLGETDPDYAYSLNNLGMLYYYLQNYEKAEALYLKAIQIRKSVFGNTHLAYAQSIMCLEGLYQEMKRYDEAEKLCLEASLIWKNTVGETHPDYGSSLNNLALLYTDMGQLAKAEELYTQSLLISKLTKGETHSDYGLTLNNLGDLYYRTAKFSKAEIAYREAANIVVKNIQQNFGFLSEQEKSNYISMVSGNFQVYQSFYGNYYTEKPSITTSAYDIQLLMKGMILDAETQMRNMIENSGDTVLLRLNKEWRNYKNSISKQYAKPLDERSPDLKLWEEEANRLEKELTKTCSFFANRQKSIDTKWQDIRNGLSHNEMALEFASFQYFNGSSRTDSILYCALIIRRQDTLPIYVPLFEENQLKGLFLGDSVRAFANLLYTDAQIRTEEHDISYGDSLYQLIWQPIEPYLKNIKHVYYSPSGILYNINFDAVPTSDDKVLSDKYFLHRLTTTSRILEKDSGNFDLTTIALFGGIQYDVDTISLKKMARQNKVKDQAEYHSNTTRSLSDSTSRGGSWSYLEGAKKEVLSIDDLLKSNNITTKVYTEQFGTEEEMKNLDSKNSPSVIHFSTHGFFFPDPVIKKETSNKRMLNNESVFKYSENPLLRSGLILSGANYVWKGGKPLNGVEDGILTAYEVSNLYLRNTKLVVMSACETGLGDIKGSEGVYGLQRAFKMAGVDYIIMTLWQVLDKETSEFMILFYQNLLKEKSIPEAFKTTQDAMKNKYREEPYKWAGFVLIH